MSELNRRQLLGGAIAAAGTAGINPAARPADFVRRENAKPGTTDWQLTYVKFDAKNKLRQSLVEGYCTRMSAKAGEKIGFCVRTEPASAFTIDLYRLGYYGGTGGRHVATLGPFEGKP